MLHENIQKHLKVHKNIMAPTICDVCDCHVFHQYTLRIIDGEK
jgi:UDP-2-acetamido-2-deoxy-ribo-hexuluronate aminotransferase